MTFRELLVRLRGASWVPPERLLALDPGETIGWSLFVNGELQQYDQLECKYDDNVGILQLFKQTSPTAVVCEDYRIYAHKADTHIGNKLFTPRLIGKIEFLCEMNSLPLAFQLAGAAKRFCTDDKLKEWGYYHKAQKHSRDSIRHGCYYLLFNKRGVK